MSKDIKESNTETFKNAEQFYSEVIAPRQANKNFVPPSWVIDFAEKYADYKAVAFYKTKLRLEYQQWETASKKILNQLDASANDESAIDKETLKG